ncbi:hypothetical protein niasHT_006503 [Heterodera trifolii]|uniref:Uncharacterized protein n=1 Tax=Heterodera trifolii TaxID=157864 RepID=A0ABD2LVN6_9BILA
MSHIFRLQDFEIRWHRVPITTFFSIVPRQHQCTADEEKSLNSAQRAFALEAKYVEEVMKHERQRNEIEQQRNEIEQQQNASENHRKQIEQQRNASENHRNQIERNHKDEMTKLINELISRIAELEEQNGQLKQQVAEHERQQRATGRGAHRHAPYLIRGAKPTNVDQGQRVTVSAAPNINFEAQPPNATDSAQPELTAPATAANDGTNYDFAELSPTSVASAPTQSLARNDGTGDQLMSHSSSVTHFAELSPTSVASAPAQSFEPSNFGQQAMGHPSNIHLGVRPPNPVALDPAQSLAPNYVTNYGQHPCGTHFVVNPPNSAASALAPNGTNYGQQPLGHPSVTHFAEPSRTSVASAPAQFLARSDGTGDQLMSHSSDNRLAVPPTFVASAPAQSFAPSNFGQQPLGHLSGLQFATRPLTSATSVPALPLAPNDVTNHVPFVHPSAVHHFAIRPLTSATSVPTQSLAPNGGTNYGPFVHPSGQHFAARPSTSAASAPALPLAPNFYRNSEGQWGRLSPSGTFHPCHPPQ